MKKWNITKEVANNWLKDRNLKVLWVNGKPTSSGRTDFFKIISFYYDDKSKGFNDCTCFISQLCQFRFNEKQENFSIYGYGYSKKDHIVELIKYSLKKLEVEINYTIE